jgi:hypothetical protein
MIKSGTGKAKQDSSFCEQKEAKKLCSWGRLHHRRQHPPLSKSFLLLFFKKEALFSP